MMKIKGRSHVERYSKTCPVRTSLQRNHVGPTLKPQLRALSVQIIQKVPNSHAPEKDSRTIYLTTPVVVFFRPTPTQHTELSSRFYIISSLSHSFSSMAQAELQEKQTNAPDSGQKYDFVGEEMERHRKRRKRRKRDCVTVEFVEKKKKGGVLRRDPLEVFGTDIMLMILSNLDARSVALSLVVSRGWYGVASSDRIWSPKLEELWLGKAHIPRLMQIRGLSKLVAYSLAVMDGKRNRIMKDDLCDHAWEFHFNKGAPEYWRNLDPYWKGTGPPMRRYFHPDGSQSADPDDKVWGGHECCYLTVTSIAGEGKIREHYVRINRWPRMSVSRKHDWSWELSNHLYSYSSIPDANKEGGTGPQYGVM